MKAMIINFFAFIHPAVLFFGSVDFGCHKTTAFFDPKS